MPKNFCSCREGVVKEAVVTIFDRHNPGKVVDRICKLCLLKRIWNK